MVMPLTIHSSRPIHRFASDAAAKAVLGHGRRQTHVGLREVPRDRRAAVLQIRYKTTGISSLPRQYFGIERDAGIQEFERLSEGHAVFRCEKRERD